MNGTDDRTQRRYSPDEVSRIIKRAFRPGQGDAISYQELSEIARELGVEPDRLDEAIQQDLAGRDLEEAREKWLRHKRSSFNGHLWSFLIVGAGLLLVNIFAGGGWWFQWPLLGWGIGLAFHIKSAFFPDERQIERGAYRMLRRERRGRY